MKKVIEKYKKGIFVYVLVNCFALVVNLFNVDTNIDGDRSYTYLFTYDNSSLPHYSELWPFVDYTESYSAGISGLTGKNVTVSNFYGIFYQYDWSEFFLYIGVLIAFLVYKSYITSPKVKVPSA